VKKNYHRNSTVLELSFALEVVKEASEEVKENLETLRSPSLEHVPQDRKWNPRDDLDLVLSAQFRVSVLLTSCVKPREIFPQSTP